jgi:GIY-YIG catalytic domain/NUMOD1 domain
MVKLKMLNIRLYSLFNKINTEYNDIIIGGGNNNNNSKYKYTKILVDDPFNNRDIILRVTKKQKGVYIWESLDGKYKYVGHSINLYNRISSYFMPSILNTKARRVLRYLNKYGFSNIKLHIYIMDEKSTLEEVVELEQHFIDSLKPNLNVDLIASSSGYHEPMSQEMRDKLRKQIGIPVYVYRAEDLTLLYIFDSKQQTYNSINIHHKTLNDCLNLGTLYLDVFFLSLDLIEESPKTDILNLEDLKILVNNNKEIYKVKHPAAKTILAEFKHDATKNLTFNSLNSLANHLKGDRQVIREYLKGNKSGYYRGKWKFTYQ